MNSQLREQAVNLRLTERFSYSAIVKKLGVPKSTLSYWLRDMPLNEEEILELRRKGWSKGEASRERFRKTMREKRELKDQEIYQGYLEEFKHLPHTTLFIAGIVLYVAEGTKNGKGALALANTDPRVVKFFIRWLNEFFMVPREQIKIGLHLYENMDVEKEKGFWKNELRLDEDQIYKPWLTKLKKSSFSYHGSYRHGTCTVYAYGTERYRQVMMAIKAFFDTTRE